MTHYPPTEDLLQEAFSKGFEQVRRRCVTAESERDELRAANHAMIRIIREHGDVEAERDAAVAANARLLARIAAVEALADKWERNAGPESRAWQVFGPQNVSVPFAVEQIRAALAASPTPTGPEPAECACPRRAEELHRSRCPLYHEMQGDGRGPATSEPTEETP